jgi:hypothetical protein
MNSSGNGNTESLFSAVDVISTYTDAQACDDGVLIALNPKDRVTRTVWEWLVEHAPKTCQPPNCWPVDMMGWFGATSIKKAEAQKLIAKHGKDAQTVLERIVADRKALAMCRGLIGRDRAQAERVYRDNTDGGILKAHAIENNGQIESLTEISSLINTTLWLVPNENDGITLMFPEDY